MCGVDADDQSVTTAAARSSVAAVEEIGRRVPVGRHVHHRRAYRRRSVRPGRTSSRSARTSCNRSGARTPAGTRYGRLVRQDLPRRRASRSGSGRGSSRAGRDPTTGRGRIASGARTTHRRGGDRRATPDTSTMCRYVAPCSSRSTRTSCSTTSSAGRTSMPAACQLSQRHVRRATAPLLGHQLEPVVVGRRPPEVEARRDEPLTPASCSAKGPGVALRRRRKSHLVPCDQMTGRGEPGLVTASPTGRSAAASRAVPESVAGQEHGDRRSRSDVVAPAACHDEPPRRRPAVPTSARRPAHVDERLPVLDPQPAPAPLDGDRPVDPGELAHRRVWVEIGRDETVGHEVAVVRRVAELAAVGEPASSRRAFVCRRVVVLPLPDESSLQSGRRT